MTVEPKEESERYMRALIKGRLGVDLESIERIEVPDVETLEKGGPLSQELARQIREEGKQ